MAKMRAFFKDAYERALVAVTLVLVALVALCYLWGVGVLLAAFRGATAPAPAPGEGKGFRVEEAEQFLKARGILE